MISLRSRVPAALLALTLLCGFAAPALAQEGGTQETTRADYDWVLFYWMAYDNNLSKCGPPIIEMLSKGITSERVAVVVVADYPDTEGLKRFVLTKGGAIEESAIKSEASADAKSVARELAWTSEHLRAKKYGLVFLNHGGALGQMSIDEHPEGGGRARWMFPPRLATEVTAWRKQAPGEAELFFFQQCGKGSLENYHALKDSARYVMGSQTIVGAPNEYYEATLRFLCENPEADGLALAKEITKRETPRMFTSYTTLDCAQLQELPKRIDAVVAPLLAKEEGFAFPQTGGKLKPCFDFGNREYFFDGIALLEGLYEANGLDMAPFESFKTWSQEQLVVSHRISPLKSAQAKASTWCGYSLLLPLSEQILSGYTKGYPIYQDTKLPALYTKIMTHLRARAAAIRKARQEKAKAGAGADK